MDLTHLRSFLATQKYGSLPEAARELGVTRSGLSRRLQSLEEDLGAELLERRGRGLVLTEMGRLVVREGRGLVERYDRLKEDVQRHVRLEAGVVRVGGGATAVSYLLPSAIAEFRREHPEVRFEVREAGSRDVEQAVRDESLELGFVTLPTESPDLVVRPLQTDRIVLVAGKGHPFSAQGQVKVEQLAGQSLVGFEAGSAIRLLIDAALREADVTMNVVMELRSIAAIVRLVETTGSLAFVSEMGAAGARVVRVRGLRLERQLALISKKGRTLSPAAAAFAVTALGVAQAEHKSEPKKRRQGTRGARRSE